MSPVYVYSHDYDDDISSTVSRARVRVPFFAFNANHELVYERLDLLHVGLFVDHLFAGASIEAECLGFLVEFPHPPGLF